MLAGVDHVPALAGRMATGGRLNARNTLEVLLGDAGDTLATAGGRPRPGGRKVRRVQRRLGDGVALRRDVDLYRFVSPAGGRFTAATGLPAGGTPVDTALRLFDASGAPIAYNDNSDGAYSRIDATLEAGTYYLGVSGSPNTSYDPAAAGGRIPGAVGDYLLTMSLDRGDTLYAATATGLFVGGDFLQANCADRRRGRPGQGRGLLPDRRGPAAR